MIDSKSARVRTKERMISVQFENSLQWQQSHWQKSSGREERQKTKTKLKLTLPDTNFIFKDSLLWSYEDTLLLLELETFRQSYQKISKYKWRTVKFSCIPTILGLDYSQTVFYNLIFVTFIRNLTEIRSWRQNQESL